MKEFTRDWRFTWNTYPGDWEEVVADSLASLKEDTGNEAEYAVFGKEEGEQTGRPHIQGHITFQHRASRLDIREHMFDAYWRTAQSPAQSIAYCQKDGDYVELGSLPKRYRTRRT